ncbi:hypothetical protein CBS147332_2555 [Penicillium roqueforti]|nr:hypothetical protein CBS147332_2555 [Penicillium roqueforti]KAI3110072.1 hypothetical protein CBS147331_5501 [Penicillium roqueforti]
MEPTMDITMNPNDSPLSNLDVWCDWSGIPEEPVSITISMELQTCGRPNLNLPILNVQSPNTTKSPSWVIELKPEAQSHYETDTPPEKEAWRFGQEYADETERYPTDNISASDFGSVVVHDGSRDDDSRRISRRTDNISGMHTRVDSSDSSTLSDLSKSQVNSPGSPSSAIPRKRSAKAASLPDSIPPDDEYQGTRRKLMMNNIDLPSTIENTANSTRTHRRSATPDESSVVLENMPLPQDSGPSHGPGSPNVASEHLSRNGNAAAVGNVPEPDENSPWCNAETPLSTTDLSGTEPLTEENLLQRNYDTLSTCVCHGSISDTEESDKEIETLFFPLESIGSVSFFSCHGLPLPQTAAEIAEKHKPKIVLDNDILYLQTPPNIYPATYQIAISLTVRLQKGKPWDWWELVVSGLPRLAQSESGYLYFRTPPGQGMEFMTSSFKRHTLVESCLMAQFYGGRNLVIPFRKCDAECFGQLKDHKVNTLIRAEVAEAGDQSSYLIKYNAACSIDLINHNFWAEQCKFCIFVHGGPDGEFDAVFTSKKPLINSIQLLAADGTGISRINIVSIPQALEMFTVSWEIKLPRGKAVTWLPWIKTTLSCSDAETVLQEDYAIYAPGYELTKQEAVPSKYQNADTRCEVSCGQLGDICVPGLNHSKPEVEITPPYLQDGSIPRFELTEPLFGKIPASRSTSTQTVAETPAPVSTVFETLVAERTKSRRVHGLWTLWTLINFFFQLLVFLASVHIISSSYFLLSHVSCEAHIYGPVNYAGNLTTNADVVQETKTVLAESNLQLEPIQPEVQQHVNTTPAEVTPISLRDRIDYILGWRGPIARE